MQKEIEETSFTGLQHILPRGRPGKSSPLHTLHPTGASPPPKTLTGCTVSANCPSQWHSVQRVPRSGGTLSQSHGGKGCSSKYARRAGESYLARKLIKLLRDRAERVTVLGKTRLAAQN